LIICAAFIHKTGKRIPGCGNGRHRILYRNQGRSLNGFRQPEEVGAATSQKSFII